MSTASGGFAFHWPLNATACQFPGVEDVLGQFDGDAAAFAELHQGDIAPVPCVRHPTAPVPITADGGIAAASYVGAAMQRFAREPWFGLVRFVNPEGAGVGVSLDVDDSGPSRDIAGRVAEATARVLADSRAFCEVQSIDVRNGPDDRSNLAMVSFSIPSSGSDCWDHRTYKVTVIPPR